MAATDTASKGALHTGCAICLRYFIPDFLLSFARRHSQTTRLPNIARVQNELSIVGRGRQSLRFLDPTWKVFGIL
jgi:hypothetical protein